MKCVIRVLSILIIGTWFAGAVLAVDPPTVTASQMQQYDGVAEGDRVRFIGICTVETPRYGYSITVACDPGGGEWAAIDVYDGVEQRLVAERGQMIDAVGTVVEYYNKTELFCNDETEFPPVALPEYGTVPAPIETNTGTMSSQESLECCIVILRNVEVLSNPDSFGNIAIDDGTGESTLLLRKIDPVPAIGFVYDCLIGHDDYHFGEFKIRPRDENDWICAGTTPTPTPTGGTPTPTPTGGCAPVLMLEFQQHQQGECFTGGRIFHPTWTMTNDCGVSKTVDLYIALQVINMFFFYPAFDSNVQGISVTIPDGEVIFENILPAFNWPDGVGSLDEGLAFWGVMTTPETFDLIGDVGMLEFCYN